jgi:predicted transcriptional regulator of viral defense system
MTDETLGPASAELVLRLSANDKTIFTIADAQAITGKDSDATKLLSQMARRRWLVRLAPGKYLIVPLEAGLENIPMANQHVIARHVAGPTPYYISHYSALELHQMIAQQVNTGYVTVPRQRANRPIAGVKYRFVYANQRAFWGFEPAWATEQEQVQVSDLEKTMDVSL